MTKGRRTGRSKAGKHKSKSKGRGGGPRYGVRFTEKGRDTLADIYAEYRDRPLYYVLDEQGEAVPLGRNYLLTVDERTCWRACYDDPERRTLQETIIPNPEHPAYPVVVHTAFDARDISFAFPLPGGAPALWSTALLDEPLAETGKRAESEEDDGSWLVEPVPEPPPELVALAHRLGMDMDQYLDWRRVYSTRAEAQHGHDETVRWVRAALGTF